MFLALPVTTTYARLGYCNIPTSGRRNRDSDRLLRLHGISARQTRTNSHSAKLESRYVAVSDTHFARTRCARRRRALSPRYHGRARVPGGANRLSRGIKGGVASSASPRDFCYALRAYSATGAAARFLLGFKGVPVSPAPPRTFSRCDKGFRVSSAVSRAVFGIGCAPVSPGVAARFFRLYVGGVILNGL